MSKLDDAFSEVLHSVGASADRLAAQSVTAFFPLQGKAYTGQLMVVGRSVNGWTEGISVAQLADANVVRSYAHELIKDSTSSDRCPMDWVAKCWGAKSGYNTKKSAFWRVIRQCEGGLGITNPESNDWASTLVWSNLYKVSPSRGYNPGLRLINAQQEAVEALFRAELDHFRPKRLLFLTGGWERPFINALASRTVGGVDVGEIAISGGGRVQFVSAPHPMGKAEAPIVSSILSGFAER